MSRALAVVLSSSGVPRRDFAHTELNLSPSSPACRDMEKEESRNRIRPALSTLSSSVSARLSPFLAVRSPSVRPCRASRRSMQGVFHPARTHVCTCGRAGRFVRTFFCLVCYQTTTTASQRVHATHTRGREAGCACSAERGAARVARSGVQCGDGEVTFTLLYTR